MLDRKRLDQVVRQGHAHCGSGAGRAAACAARSPLKHPANGIEACRPTVCKAYLPGQPVSWPLGRILP